MAASSLSTIAQLLCYQSLPVNFAKLIGEVDSLLDQDLHGPFKVSWDCDSAACFDQSGTRVLLAWNEYPGQGLSGVLTVSVGPSPLAGKPCMRPDHGALAMRLADHLAQRTQHAGQFARTDGDQRNHTDNQEFAGAYIEHETTSPGRMPGGVKGNNAQPAFCSALATG